MLLLLTQIVVLIELHVFLQLSSIGLFEAKRAYLSLETPKLNEVFLSKLNSVLKAKQCANVAASSKMIFFGEIHVFLQLCFIGLFGANAAYLHNENYELQEVFLSKSNSILTGKQCAM
jgi:hypothetical protein